MTHPVQDPYPDAPRAPPARDSAPVERWQHGCRPAVVMGQQRVERPVDVLRARGSIGDAEVQAATRYYEDYAFGLHGAGIEQRGGSGGGADGYSIAQIEALGRFRDVGRRLDPATVGMLGAIVLDELSLRVIAIGRFGPKDGVKTQAREKVSKQAVAALRSLADLYAAWAGTRPARGGDIRSAVISKGA